MKKYEIQPMKEPLPQLAGENFDPECDDFCQETPYAPIDSYVWGNVGGYMPEARAYVVWDDEGLHVLMCALEKEIQVEATEFNGDVYKDSCLEFFLMPFPEQDKRYLNFEVNAHGVALIGFGSDRFNRYCLEKMPEGMNMGVSRHRGGWWAISYTVPNALLQELYGRTLKGGDVMRANFYKCDESIHPHFGSWSPIVHFCPDFHRPEWFGEVRLAPVTEL